MELESESWWLHGTYHDFYGGNIQKKIDFFSPKKKKNKNKSPKIFKNLKILLSYTIKNKNKKLNKNQKLYKKKKSENIK